MRKYIPCGLHCYVKTQEKPTSSATSVLASNPKWTYPMEPAELEDRLGNRSIQHGPRRSVQTEATTKRPNWNDQYHKRIQINELYPKHRNQLLYVGRQITKKLWQLCGNSGRVLYRWQEFGICFLLGNKSRMQLTLRFHTLLLGWIFASRF